MNGAAILFITLSNIGDAVLTTPVLQSLLRLFPDAPLDIIADRRSSALFEHCPRLRRLVHKDKDRPLRGLPPLVHELRDDYYRLIVDLRTGFLPWLLRAAARRARRGAGTGHAVQRHMSVIADLVKGAPIPGTAVWLGEADRAFARDALGDMGGGRLLALGPGANWPPKIWPAAGFRSLIDLLQAEFDACVLLGDGRDADIGAVLERGARLPCINLCGGTGLRQAAAVLEQARAFVGNDSGLGHLASAVGTPSLTLFGPGDPRRYHPWGPRAAWLAAPGGELSRLPAPDAAAALRSHLAGLAGTASG